MGAPLPPLPDDPDDLQRQLSQMGQLRAATGGAAREALQRRGGQPGNRSALKHGGNATARTLALGPAAAAIAAHAPGDELDQELLAAAALELARTWAMSAYMDRFYRGSVAAALEPAALSKEQAARRVLRRAAHRLERLLPALGVDPAELGIVPDLGVSYGSRLGRLQRPM